MRDILYKIFVKNWPRKLISVILAFIIWGDKMGGRSGKSGSGTTPTT